LSKQADNKDRIRVYEYAKTLNMSSKELIKILDRVGMPVNNHMSVMEPEMIERVEQFFRDIKANAAARRSDPSGQQVKRDHRPAEARPAASSEPRTAASASDARASAGKPAQQSAAHAKPAGDRAQQEQRKTGNQQPQRHDRDANKQRPRDQQAANHRPQQGASGGTTNMQVTSSGHAQTGTQQATQPSNQRQNDQAKNRNDRPKHDHQQNKSQQSQAEQRASRPSPQPAADVRAIDLDDDLYPAVAAAKGPRLKAGGRFEDVTKGKTTKKTKSSNKRFDDNKASNIKQGAGRKGQGKNRGQQERREKVDNTPKKVIVRGTMTVGELAKLIHKDAPEVIKKLLMMGVMATINQELDLDTIQLVIAEYGIEVELKIPVNEDNFEEIEEQDDPKDLVERPPVVTIMGHVDHGKTTLLDAIRHTNVTEGEAGGITQHIGAYQVEIQGKKITFLDTPGHEAFTTMRARGAQVTDITIIVVAADDGVMPQTVEAINHAKAAHVPIIVAVNKIDKPEANPERVKQELTEHGIVPEEWGGDNIFVNISAKQKIGLEELLETILLVAEVQDLKANPNKRARGTVLEAELDKQRGPVARVLIQHGTLRVGDAFVAGVRFGRVRAMINDRGRRLKEAGPSTPVEITGLTEVPQAGDPFLVFEDERKAKEIAERRSIKLRQEELKSQTRVTLDDLYKHIKEGEMKELHVILKADVQGSLEALKGSLEKIDIEGVRVKTIHAAVGAITESDITLASASNAIVIGFNVRPEPQAKAAAEIEKVDIRLHRIIYQVIDEIEAAMKGMLDPEYKESVIGHAEVRNIFKVSKIGTIAGCMVVDGKIVRNAEARIVRDGIVIYEGKIDSLKRFKDDVREVAQGYECGISFEKFNDIKEGDIIEAYVMETVER